MKPVTSTVLGTVFSVLALSTIPALAEQKDDSHNVWRLFVADHTQPVVRAIDLESGKEIGHYDVKGYANLVTSASGQTVFAAQPDFDIVHAIKTGINLSDHGDHKDIDISDPALLAQSFEGPRPYHVVPHDDHAIIFYDNSGKAEILDEASLLKGKADVRTLDATAPHHGVALSMGDYVLLSVPDTSLKTEPGKLPPRIGLRAVDAKGEQVGETAPCTDLHGEAMSARLAAFGCKQGVLIAQQKGGQAPQFKMLDYPADFPKGHVGTLLGGKAMQFFLGNYGDDKVVLIDPENEKPYKLVELPTRRVDFALDQTSIRNAYILTEDGDLHVLDVLKGELVNKAKVTEPYSKDGHWRDPRPRLAIANGKIVITDPRHSLLRVIDAKTLKEERTIPVEGQPFTITVAGGSGVQH